MEDLVLCSSGPLQSIGSKLVNHYVLAHGCCVARFPLRAVCHPLLPSIFCNSERSISFRNCTYSLAALFQCSVRCFAIEARL